MTVPGNSREPLRVWNQDLLFFYKRAAIMSATHGSRSAARTAREQLCNGIQASTFRHHLAFVLVEAVSAPTAPRSARGTVHRLSHYGLLWNEHSAGY